MNLSRPIQACLELGVGFKNQAMADSSGDTRHAAPVSPSTLLVDCSCCACYWNGMGTPGDDCYDCGEFEGIYATGAELEEDWNEDGDEDEL